jgi:hypothetical protein
MLPTKFQFSWSCGFRGEYLFRNRPIRNTYCLWWPCLLTDRTKRAIFMEHLTKILLSKFQFVTVFTVFRLFILITKHTHMYINSRIIQTKQKRFFPFFSFFVNRYDIICILIAESCKQNLFSFFIPFFSC